MLTRHVLANPAPTPKPQSCRACLASRSSPPPAGSMGRGPGGWSGDFSGEPRPALPSRGWPPAPPCQVVSWTGAQTSGPSSAPAAKPAGAAAGQARRRTWPSHYTGVGTAQALVPGPGPGSSGLETRQRTDVGSWEKLPGEGRRGELLRGKEEGRGRAAGADLCMGPLKAAGSDCLTCVRCPESQARWAAGPRGWSRSASPGKRNFHPSQRTYGPVVSPGRHCSQVLPTPLPATPGRPSSRACPCGLGRL